MIDKFELINNIETATKQIDEGLGIAHEKVCKQLKGRILA
jgi:hypothetical protein